MKSTGIIREVDNLGRYVLPKEIRKTLGMDVGTKLEVFVENDMVILKRYSETCFICGSDSNLTKYKDRLVCKACIKDIKNLI